MFLSYAHADKDVARLLPMHVRSVGADCLMDEEFLRSDFQFQSKIKQRIVTSNEMLILTSQNFVPRRWFAFELGIAEGADVEIAPIAFRITREELREISILRVMPKYDLADLRDYLKDLHGRILRRGEPPRGRTGGGHAGGGAGAARKHRTSSGPGGALEVSITDYVKKLRGES